MDIIERNLKDEGTLIWGAPVGWDALVWNAHRIYGPIRMPKLFKNFLKLEWYGKSKGEIFKQGLSSSGYQPVIVFKKKNS